jgi:hypothetical protein
MKNLINFDDNLKNNLLKKSENQNEKRCRRSRNATKKSAAISSISQHINNRKKQKVLYFNTDRSSKVCFKYKGSYGSPIYFTI